MATKFLEGWDIDTNSSLQSIYLGSAGTSTEWGPFGYWPMTEGIYHNKGVATLDNYIYPVNNGSNSAGSINTTGRISGACYGSGVGISSVASNRYDGTLAVTRALWAASQGHQLAVVRSMRGIGADIWINFDFKLPSIPAASLTGYQPSASWGAIFKWGDVELVMKNTTYTTAHSVVISIRNNGIEVATLTIPNVPSITISSTTAEWRYASLHVKLDATTGLIEFAVDGIAQSVAYTGQNTVTTTSLVSAPYIFFGPPVWDNGTTAYLGLIDNFHIDDAAFTAGRINFVMGSISSTDASLTAALGFPSGTFGGAINNSTDSFAGRFSGPTGKAVITTSAPTAASLTTYLSEIIAVHIIAKKVTSRNPIIARRLQMGIRVGGTDYMGLFAKSKALPFSSSSIIPEGGAFAILNEMIFEKSAGVRFTSTEVNSLNLGIVFASASP